MIISFSVENFRSIRDQVTLSFVPSADTEHPENVVSQGGHHALSTIALYGANASGKTNIIMALTTALITIRRSNQLQVTDQLPLMVPFLFDNDSKTKPCKFEFEFVAGDGLKYIYGFSADKERVHEEYLYVYHTAKPSKIFDKARDSGYSCPKADKPQLDAIIERNTQNKLLIATATAWNYAKTKAAYEWLATDIDSFSDLEQMTAIAMEKYVAGEDGELKKFTTKLLQNADINISDFLVDVKDAPLSFNPLSLLPPEIAAEITNGQAVGVAREIRITTTHQIEGKDFLLNLNEESLGTRQLFMLSPFLYGVFSEGKTLVVDELDRSMHPAIVKYLVDLFRNETINSKHAQLFFTTHDTTLLSLDTFRRDEIYFAEKKESTGVTDLYSLDEFSVRKTDNIQKGYLLGRYGAIPYLRGGEFL